MIGSGKTTTAGHLADWLARRGEHVRAFDEGAAAHPIRTRRVAELLGAPAPGCTRPGSRWRSSCSTGTRSASSWCPIRSTTGRPPCGPSAPPPGPRAGAYLLVEAVRIGWGRRRTIIVAVAVAVTASTDQG